MVGRSPSVKVQNKAADGRKISNECHFLRVHDDGGGPAPLCTTYATDTIDLVRPVVLILE